MIGRKLNAQSCTMLLLVVVGVLLSLNLYAQLGSSRSDESGYDYNNRDLNRQMATAATSLAEATDRVAEANQQIAKSIDKLASAVGDLELVVDLGEKGVAPAAASSTEPEPAAPTTTQGIFKLN